MKSPFPGMDPYLERHWSDVHTSFMVSARNQLNAFLPDDLQARVEESLSVEVDEYVTRAIYADVRVVEESPATSTQTALATSAETLTVPAATPLVLELDVEPRTQRHIEIVDIDQGGRVITAIEVLSPANKIGQVGRRAYRQKQQEYLQAGVSLVEIDLLRTGDFILAAPEERIPPEYRTPYKICVRPSAHPTRALIYRAPLREPLPNIAIPLRQTDQDVVLQLQPVIDECYRGGRYDRINYQQNPTPRLQEDDASWADQRLREQDRRTDLQET